MSLEVDKSSSYAAAPSNDSAADSAEKAQRKIAVEVRSRLRRFANEAPLTPKWAELVEPLRLVAGVAQQEADRAAAAGPSPTEAAPAGGSQPEKATTVWERDQVVVRVVVEEGKINLLAKSLREFKEAIYACPGKAAPPEMAASAAAYEQSLGYIVRAALTAVECVQTLNLVSLLEHVAMVLARSLEADFNPTPADVAMQECTVIHYLRLVCAQLDRLQSGDSVAAKMAELAIVPMVLKHLEKFRAVADADLVAGYAFFFANLADSEAFKGKPQAFFDAKDEKKAFALALDPVLKEHLGKNPADKKALRPASDLVLRW
eukprot:CAMPEP_0174833512 /NCGR_PEP_ID=MMETSP1114-20130205/4278_1 /TAXON_ID=312471 /ORGANISM="Neobodo designis, Strain CCAP 1951/1" /LENGTH=317 /DNA_ID=CAMNT_0016067395 /DNA_START=112 /DNA_END=1062 /DNA_ORIENTATION=-